MTKHPVLEICVETLEAAAAAERGGADRIELCENLRVGGVTPRAALIQAVRAQVQIPIFVMIRPRGGDFFYSAAEFGRMVRDLEIAKACGTCGVVLGLLRPDLRVNVERTRELVELARPLPVTFHRAFDDVANSPQALEDVIAAGAARVLTSGGKATVEDGMAAIAGLVEAAGPRIAILPGGGISAANIERVAAQTRAREFHSGLSTVLPSPQTDYLAFEAEVRRLAELLRKRPIEGLGN